MRFRLPIIVILALLVNLLFAGSPQAIHEQPPALLDCPSPPAGLELPVGQGLVVMCYLHATTAATIHFSVDGVLQHTTQVEPEGSATLTWVPDQVGSHTLTIAAQLDGRPVIRTTHWVQVVPAHFPVRIP